MARIPYLLLTIAVIACNPPKSAGDSDVKIVGGKAVTKADDPTLASTVAFLYYGESFCSGTIIGPNHIVTAAHCLEGIPEDIAIGFGAIAKEVKGIKIVKRVHHPDYTKKNKINDIGIVLFSGDLPKGYHPVAIAGADVPVGTKTILAGYGVTGDGKEDVGILRRVTTKIASFNTEHKEFSFVEGNFKGSCDGDSGGPVFVKTNDGLTVIGATSRGRSCNPGNGVNTDVRKFTSWMTCEFAKNGQPLANLPDDGFRSLSCEELTTAKGESQRSRTPVDDGEPRAPEEPSSESAAEAADPLGTSAEVVEGR